MTPTIGSLCSGYGGLDLAVETVFGARTVWHCQYEPPVEGKKPKPLAEQAPSKILAAHWDVPNHGDLTTVDWTTVEPVDIIAAGYPCQPDSMAGKGLSEDDHRWIWPDIARAVGVLRPRYVVLENVQGHFVRGFRTVLGSLTSLGYDVRWTLVRASDIGAPHRRERMFVVATDADDRAEYGQWSRAESWQGVTPASDASDERHERGGIARGRGTGPAVGRGAPANTSSGCHGRLWTGEGCRCRETAADSAFVAGGERHGDDVLAGRGTDRCEPAAGGGTPADTTGERRRTARGNDGVRTEGLVPSDIAWGAYEPAIRRWERVLGRVAPAPTERGPKGGQRLSPRFVEWMMGLPAGWVTDVPIRRNEQLKALGNGVVPQQAEAALRMLLSVDACGVAA